VRFWSLDFLRGLFAVFITFGHAMTAAPYTFAGPWFEQLCVHIMWLSFNGIPIFFAISGFCIHLAQQRHGGTFKFVAFWRRRLWRLYPTYFVALVGSIGLLLLMWASGTGEEMLDHYPEPILTSIATDFGLHALMLHGLYPPYDQGAGNPPMWTLAREEYLYLMYPLLLFVRPRVAWNKLAMFLAGLSLIFQYGLTRFVSTTEAIWLLIYSAPALWIQWHVGVVAADAYLGVIRLPPFWQQARWIPVWMLLGYLFNPGSIFLALACFTAVNVCVRLEAQGRWPAGGIVGAISRVGLWSYSLYLVHFPVLTVTLAASRLVWPEVGVVGFVVRALVMTVISCIAGRLFFEVIERHFVTLPRRADHRPLPTPVASVAGS
jgi:peptidoglycan/LPS O-acetylase OafA/YrhL